MKPPPRIMDSEEALASLRRFIGMGLQLSYLEMEVIAGSDGIYHDSRPRCGTKINPHNALIKTEVTLEKVLWETELFCKDCIPELKPMGMKVSTWITKAEIIESAREALKGLTANSIESAYAVYTVRNRVGFNGNWPPLVQWGEGVIEGLKEAPIVPVLNDEEIAKLHKTLVMSALGAPSTIMTDGLEDVLASYQEWLTGLYAQLNADTGHLLVYTRHRGLYNGGSREEFYDNLASGLYNIGSNLYLMPAVLKPWALRGRDEQHIYLDELPGDDVIENLKVLFKPHDCEGAYTKLTVAYEAAKNL